MDQVIKTEDLVKPQTLDELEKEIRSYDVDPTNYQLKKLISTTLQLLNMCRKMHKAQSEILLQLILSSKNDIEAMLKSGSLNMMKEVDKIMDFVMKSNVPSHLVQLARAFTCPINYSHTEDLITMSLSTKEYEQCDPYLTIKHVNLHGSFPHFILDTQDVPEKIRAEYGFPFKFKILEDVIAHLNGGVMTSIAVSILDYYKNQDGSDEDDDRNDLAASAIFSTK